MDRYRFIYVCVYTYIYMHAADVVGWPLQDIVTANIVLCMANTRGVGWGVVYCALDAQSYCNRVSNADRGGDARRITSARKLWGERTSCEGQVVGCKIP